MHKVKIHRDRGLYRTLFTADNAKSCALSQRYGSIRLRRSINHMWEATFFNLHCVSHEHNVASLSPLHSIFRWQIFCLFRHLYLSTFFLAACIETIEDSMLNVLFFVCSSLEKRARLCSVHLWDNSLKLHQLRSRFEQATRSSKRKAVSVHWKRISTTSHRHRTRWTSRFWTSRSTRRASVCIYWVWSVLRKCLQMSPSKLFISFRP